MKGIHTKRPENSEFDPEHLPQLREELGDNDITIPEEVETPPEIRTLTPEHVDALIEEHEPGFVVADRDGLWDGRATQQCLSHGVAVVVYNRMRTIDGPLFITQRPKRDTTR